jgi:ankyrin repeat protein
MNTLGWAHGRPEPVPSGDLTSEDVVRRLLAAGADVNARLTGPKLQRHHTPGDPGLAEGATPLMRAAKTGDVSTMRLLLERGAVPTATQADGTTLFMIAAGMGWRGGHHTSRDRGTEAGAIEAMSLCLQLGSDVNASRSDGQTALHGAIGRGEGVLRFLVANGADVGTTDHDGRTALDLAIEARDYADGTDHVGTEVRQRAVAVLRELGGGAR